LQKREDKLKRVAVDGVGVNVEDGESENRNHDYNDKRYKVPDSVSRFSFHGFWHINCTNKKQVLNRDYSPCIYSFGQWQSDEVIKKDLAKSFGVILQNRRKSAKMSQEKLSEKADVDVKMISRIETFIRNPSLNLADSLANALGVPLSKMIKEAEDLRRKERRK
jgi:DNA-binding XRE family transcriptional regulator